MIRLTAVGALLAAGWAAALGALAAAVLSPLALIGALLGAGS